MSEHLKFCTEINEYWLDKNACLDIVLSAIQDCVNNLQRPGGCASNCLYLKQSVEFNSARFIILE